MTHDDERTLQKANAILKRLGHKPITPEAFRLMGLRARMAFLDREVGDCGWALERARMALLIFGE